MKKKRIEFNVAFPESVIADHQDAPIINSDVFGSYTGIPQDRFETPIQDADDL